MYRYCGTSTVVPVLWYMYFHVFAPKFSTVPLDYFSTYTIVLEFLYKATSIGLLSVMLHLNLVQYFHTTSVPVLQCQIKLLSVMLHLNLVHCFQITLVPVLQYQIKLLSVMLHLNLVQYFRIIFSADAIVLDQATQRNLNTYYRYCTI